MVRGLYIREALRKTTKGSEVHWFTLSGRCLNVKMNLFAFAETQLSRGLCPTAKESRVMGKRKFNRELEGQCSLPCDPGGSRDCEPSARLVQLLQSVKNRVRGDFSNSSGISVVFLHF